MTPLEIASLVADWKARLRPNSTVTYKAALIGVCKLCDRLHGTRLQDTIPRVPPSQLRTLTATDTEYGAILRTAKPWMRVFLTLARTLGLRRGEALALTPASFQHDGKTLSFRRKMDGASNIPVTPELEQLLLRFADQPNLPILEQIAGRPVTRQMLNWEWHRLRKKCGINPLLTAHDLRRTVAKRIYDQTHDLRIVQQLLGHRSISTTLRYIGAIDTRSLRTAILNALPTALPLFDDAEIIPLASERPQ